MKALTAWFLLLGSPALLAIPHRPFTVEEISGEVEFAVWRSAIVLDRVFATPKGQEQNTRRDVLPNHWIVLLREVKGVTKEQRNSISGAFAVTPTLPIDWSRKRYLRVQDKNFVYIRINGDAKWPIKVGSKISIKKLNYEGLDFSGWITIESLEIDGKPVSLPDTPQNGKKKVEQHEESDAG